MSKVICRRLNSKNEVIETFTMNRKTAREIVRKGQGDWLGNMSIVLFYKDDNGRYHPPITPKEARINYRGR
jgi:hypothetical protein